MNNIILGFNDNENIKIERMLRQINYVVYSKQTNFNDILRLEKELYNPIIITKERLKDGNVYDFLNYTSKHCEHIIITNKIQQFDEFISKTIYLSNVIKKRQMNIALNMLTNFNNVKLNNYKINNDEVDYEKAKGVLMSNFDFTENLSHKFIQKRCMNLCVKKDVVSEIILYSIK